MSVKWVGIKEFKDRATQLLASGEPLVIERHGKTIGYYTPLVRKDLQKVRETIDRLDATMERAARQAGMRVEELEDLMLADLG